LSLGTGIRKGGKRVTISLPPELQKMKGGKKRRKENHRDLGLKAFQEERFRQFYLSKKKRPPRGENKVTRRDLHLLTNNFQKVFPTARGRGGKLLPVHNSQKRRGEK